MRPWLKTRREKMKLTHEVVAERAGISRSYYTLIESGFKTTSVKVAKKIATELKFEWTRFFANKCSLKEQNQGEAI